MSELESRVSVLEAVLPRVEAKIDIHMKTSNAQSAAAEITRKEVVKGLDELRRSFDARENQAKGAFWLLLVVTGAVGAAITKIISLFIK